MVWMISYMGHLIMLKRTAQINCRVCDKKDKKLE